MHAAPQKIATEEAETLAMAAFSAITGDEERMSRFMAISGLQAGDDPPGGRILRDSSPASSTMWCRDEPLLVALAQRTERQA